LEVLFIYNKDQLDIALEGQWKLPNLKCLVFKSKLDLEKGTSVSLPFYYFILSNKYNNFSDRFCGEVGAEVSQFGRIPLYNAQEAAERSD